MDGRTNVPEITSPSGSQVVVIDSIVLNVSPLTLIRSTMVGTAPRRGRSVLTYQSTSTSHRSSISGPSDDQLSFRKNRTLYSKSASPDSDGFSPTFFEGGLEYSDALLDPSVAFGLSPHCRGGTSTTPHPPFSCRGCQYCDSLLGEAKQRLAVLQRERQREVRHPTTPSPTGPAAWSFSLT